MDRPHRRTPHVASALPVNTQQQESPGGAHSTALRSNLSSGAAPLPAKKKRKAPQGGKNCEASQVPGKGNLKESTEGPGKGDVEETLEEKMVSLGIAVEADAPNRGLGLPPRQPSGSAVGAPVRADSLLVLLHQAVMAEDEKLLEKCLAVQDENVIQNTVRRLAPPAATKFLGVAAAKFQARPHRSKALLPWLRALILNHASVLMSSPGAQPLLLSLYQDIDSRLATFQPMLALSGRLDLVVTSMRAISQQRTSGYAGTRDEEELVGVAVYDEEDNESDVDVEDATREQSKEPGGLTHQGGAVDEDADEEESEEESGDDIAGAAMDVEDEEDMGEESDEEEGDEDEEGEDVSSGGNDDENED